MIMKSRPGIVRLFSIQEPDMIVSNIKKMVALLWAIQEKWQIDVIDLWNDPWKALLRAGSRGCSETDYGQNLMRKMMMSYDSDPKEYARLAGFGYNIYRGK